jgi:hypothetical protein
MPHPSRTNHLRLVACEGELLAPLRDDPCAGRGTLRITIDEIEVGRVTCSAEEEGTRRGASDRAYAALGEEALLTAVRSVLSIGDLATTLRLHLEPPALGSSAGPLEAVAHAARLGQWAATATVVLSAGGTAVGRGGVVTLIRPAGSLDVASTFDGHGANTATTLSQWSTSSLLP